MKFSEHSRVHACVIYLSFYQYMGLGPHYDLGFPKSINFDGGEHGFSHGSVLSQFNGW